MPNRTVEEVFVTEGVPQFTFVNPPNFGEILIDIRRPGKPVVIEGQSGTGKTTCVKKVLEQIGQESDSVYLTARKAEDVGAIISLAEEPTTGTFIIDDFHRLASSTQADIADLAKSAAETSDEEEFPKLVLIGINNVGSELIELVPDIAKRTGIHKIAPGNSEIINALIKSGAEELNVRIDDWEGIFEESGGDYWLTQQLCQTICVSHNVYETQENEEKIEFDIDKVRERVVDKLSNAYYPAVKEFSRGRRFRPTNDPYFKLLRTISQEGSAIADLNMLANKYEDVRGSINNIKEHRLNVLLEDKPLCARHFYYNSDTKNFVIEDPALFYFIANLNWDELRRDCGFREDSEDYRYDVALSFAGENRELAKHVADQLSVLDMSVFFDEYFESNFLGKTWNNEFKNVFSKESRIVVCFLDSHHNEKIWPTFERECFRPRVKEAEVIPVYLDDTPFVGIPSDIVGIKPKWDTSDPDWEKRAVDDIVFPIAERLS